jgi:predicted small metal-binding protein
MKTQLDCPCGQHLVGKNEDELVKNVRTHLKLAHPGHDYDRDEILELAYS